MSKNMDMALLLDIYGDMLTEKQNDTLSLYYNEDLSLTEIAENTGITRQGVHKCIKSAVEYLVQLEETMQCAEKFRKISVQTEKLRSLLLGILDKDSSEYKEIDSCIENIEELI